MLLGVSAGAPAFAGSLAVSPGAAFAGRFGLEVTPGSTCGGPSVLSLPAGPLSQGGVWEACEELSAAAVMVEAPAGVTLRAGRRVVLGSGFSVAPGSRLTVETAPSLSRSAFVEDRSPRRERRYRVRFYVRADLLAQADGESFDLFAGYDPAGALCLRVKLKRNEQIQPPETRLVLEAVDAAGAVISQEGVAEIVLPSGWHAVELDWRAADAGRSDGFLDISLDGQPWPGLTGLANSGGVIDLIRWGAVSSVEASTGGTLALDELVSRRDGAIGLLP